MRQHCTLLLLFAFFTPANLRAQDPPASEHHHSEAAPAAGWSWTADGNAFFGYNYQLRPFADHSAWESQNWLMGSINRPVGKGRVTFDGMLSLEPFTMHDIGSPQLFQTGESYQQIPLVNYQHPHDFLMGLGVTYRLPQGRATYTLGADLVGTPTLGPLTFMHRNSARDNPQVPLTHHYLDSTHSTAGVLRAGFTFGTVTIESSVFRGAGPDEDRLNIEDPHLDSWAARVWWRRGPWAIQFSGGRLRQPEWFEPFDATKLTASISYDGQVWSKPFNTTLAWGENRQFNGINGNADSYLLEWRLLATNTSTTYGRLEVGDKELFGLGPHPKEFVHPHWFSTVTAFTVGYIHDLSIPRVGRIGAGADITVYGMEEDMKTFYESSRSFHVFLRWRPAAPPAHIH